MTLRARLALLIVLLTALPALTAAWIVHSLLERSLQLGLSQEVDAALQAGIEEARRNLQAQRREAETRAQAWARVWPPGVGGHDADLDVESVAARLRGAAREHAFDLAPRDGERVVLIDPNGVEAFVRGPQRTETAPRPAAPGQPPRHVRAQQPLPDGWRVEVELPTDPTWRDNAQRLADVLQMHRGLNVQRGALARSFWLPFLVVYGAALLVGLALAMRLARGITQPVGRLLEAMDAVGAGRRDVRLAPAGPAEIARAAERFNAMTATLDAQHRRLVDLQTMAGWREMARALAHEVKNPLTPIQLTVEEMRERYRGDDADYRALLDECTRIVVEEVESLRNVVTRFREFSRPVELRPEPVDARRLVKDIAALQRDLQVEVEIDGDPGSVHADPDRLRQVLLNLTENARQATRGTTTPRLALGVRRHGDVLQLHVEDNGPGIPAAERERVFEPYRSGAAGGLGLGLALVKGIVLAHGGDIAVRDGRWGGARFEITLPVRGPVVAGQGEASQHEAASPPAPRLRADAGSEGRTS